MDFIHNYIIISPDKFPLFLSTATSAENPDNVELLGEESAVVGT